MNKRMIQGTPSIIGFLVLLLSITSARAETRYIDDTLYAPLRSGEGLGFRIVHKGVKSGTRLELLESNSASGYSKVVTPEGIEGWLPTRYLVKEPIARIKLQQLTTEHNRIQERFQEISAKNQEMQEFNDTITEKNRHLTESNKNLLLELADIKRISTNAMTLDKRNRELRELNEQYKNELEVLTSENMRLSENNERDKMLIGGGLVIAGVLIAVLIPMFKKDKRDSW